LQNEIKISNILNDNLTYLDSEFNECPDIIRRKLSLSDGNSGYLFYIEGLVDTDLLQRDIIAMFQSSKVSYLQNKDFESILPVANITIMDGMKTAVNDITAGRVVILVDKISFAISCDIKKFEHRSIDEPVTEKNVRGPHDGFIESIGTNMSILRRKFKNQDLKFRLLTIGERTNQKVAIAYIKGIANPKYLEILCEKISSINMDGILAIGYIEQLISDFKKSPFPQYQTSERPDKAAAGLLEGRFVIMLDGTPVILIAPVSFHSFFQALDDYSTHWYFGSSLRILRMTAPIISVFLPALYIAIVSYHYYMVPLNLLIPLAESRQKVPFPPIIEALIMELIIEMLREASIRLPTYIGTSLGVVGGLIIGQAAVEAGIVSTLMIIVVAITAISSYLIPNYDMGLALRSIRFVVMIMSSLLGLVGIVICAATLLAHLVTIESLGQPYFQPIIPFKSKDQKDVSIRGPLKFFKHRPNTTNPKDKKRSD
jgi:spore germination protein